MKTKRISTAVFIISGLLGIGLLIFAINGLNVSKINISEYGTVENDSNSGHDLVQTAESDVKAVN